MTMHLACSILAAALAAGPADPAPGSPAPESPTPEPAASVSASVAEPELDDDPEPEAPFADDEPAPAPKPKARSDRPTPSRETAPVAEAGVRRTTPTYTDRAIRWRFDLSATGGSTIVRDRGYFAFSNHNRSLSGFGLVARADVRLADGRFFLGGGVGYRRTSQHGSVYEGLYDLALVAHDPYAFFRASMMAIEGIDIYVQGGIGPSIVRLSTAAEHGEHAQGRSIAAAVEALGGLTLYLPKRWLPRKGAARMTGGLDVGVGYEYRTAIDVRPTIDRADDAIPTRSPALGDLALRGVLWRIGVFIRVM